jgi:hypothetical protein
MNTTKILAALDDELVRLRRVRDLLTSNAPEEPAKKRRGRPAKNAPKPVAPVAVKKRNLSDEARQRIAEAQKRRWAAQREEAR